MRKEIASGALWVQFCLCVFTLCGEPEGNRYHALEFIVEKSTIKPPDSVDLIQTIIESDETDEPDEMTAFLFMPKEPEEGQSELKEFSYVVEIPPDGLMGGDSGSSAQGIVAEATHFSSGADFSFRTVTWPASLPSNWVLDDSYGANHQAEITVTLNAEASDAKDSTGFELDGGGSIKTLDWSSHQRKQAEEDDDGGDVWEIFGNPDGIGQVQAADNPKRVLFSLLKVDIEVPKVDSEGNEISGEFVPTDELKIAKWENSFFGSANKPTLKNNFIDSDVDRFKVSFPMKPDLGTIKMKLSVKEGNQTIDDATEIELNETPAGSGNYESDTMILVFDNVDDDLVIAGVSDDELNDRTHKATVNSKVILHYEDLFEFSVDVFKKGKITITPTIVRLHSGGPRSTLSFSALATMHQAEEAYAQVGIDFDIKPTVTIDPPAGVNLQDAHGVTVLDESGALTPEVLALVGTDSHDDIRVYFVNKIYSAKYNDSGFLDGGSIGGTNNILIATEDGAPDGIVSFEDYNFAHEITHQLTGMGHPNWLTERDQFINLLWSITEGGIATDLDDPVSPRRLNREQEALMHNHESVK